MYAWEVRELHLAVLFLVPCLKTICALSRVVFKSSYGCACCHAQDTHSQGEASATIHSAGVASYPSRSQGPAVAGGGFSRFDGLVVPWGGLGGVTMFVKVGSQAHRWLQAKSTVDVPLPLYGTSAKVSLDMEPGLAE